ncbi:epidermal retinol dehydrogenase 2-like [Anneissia japonica]|uniref:epidermal retinol dehydrogenase 2-like n=1 Tax=Anneissia japonica TaxID=1529436 RepID=UPI00142597D3|nr:epidermal retinol dehydrogenase 2-like [Anneissia japonica]XP_033099453.1 epidermal retinol dehydrogenase 2-like [Anneissia japonica]XP_033099454.1 epidermal retinol dehydrogenase 2-like [Anneissia japonica]
MVTKIIVDFLEGIYVHFMLLVDMIVAIVLFIIPKKSKDVAGEFVLVTGSGSGIGRLLALEFAKRGATLVLWDINESAIKDVAGEIEEQGGEAYTYKVDLSKREEVYSIAEKVKKDVGDIDILVNNAGVVTGKKFMDSPDKMIQLTMDVNIGAHFWTIKSFLPSMIERNHGHIVTIASSAGLFGTKGLIDYCASKFAAVGLDESLRYELMFMGNEGVHTTVVCPFFINTGMFDGVKTRFPSLLPIIEPEVAVAKIMSGILTNEKEVYAPGIIRVLVKLRDILPDRAKCRVFQFFGTDTCMDHFVGRTKND